MIARLRVVCPVLNEASGLDELLLYLDGLTGRSAVEVEVCVVDAGSSDGTRQILERHVERRSGSSGSGFRAIFGSLQAPSVARTVNLGLDGLRESDFFLVHPADCRISSSGWTALLAAVASSKMDHFVFEKSYSPQGVLLWVYSLLLNGVLLRLGRCWVWTNLPCFRFSVLQEAFGGAGGRFPELGFLEDLASGRRFRERGHLMTVLPAQVQVSSRRYVRDGSLKRIILNGVITVLFFAGMRDYRKLKQIFYRS